MTVTQISVFLENRPGQLKELVDALSAHKIDMRALSIADTRDFGILRVIVDDPAKAAQVLQEAQFVFSASPVLAVAIADAPGALAQILDILERHRINLEYAYAFIARRADCAYLILRVEDNEQAAAALSGEGVRLVAQEEIFTL